MRRRDFLRTLVSAGAAAALGTLSTQITRQTFDEYRDELWRSGRYFIGCDPAAGHDVGATVLMFLNQEGAYSAVGEWPRDSTPHVSPVEIDVGAAVV